MAKKKKKEEDLEQIEQVQDEPDHGEIFVSWQFLEHAKHQRGRLWYVIFALVFIGLIVFAYLNKNPLFAIIIVLGLIVYVISERRAASPVQFSIAEDGILLNEKLIPFEEFDSFYIIYYPPEIKKLYFQPRNSIKQRISISLENQNPVDIRQLLLEYLPEDLAKEEIPTSEGLSNSLKF